MKHGRILRNGRLEPVTEVHTADGPRVRLADGSLAEEAALVWLPPVRPGTIFALGLNYADHARELSFQPPKEPLVFLKGPNALCGHRSAVARPRDVVQMHYECELAVVIGRSARNVSRSSALDFVRGYTIANDYAFREYLENYFRPNFRVKSRDRSTPLGPWLVDSVDVPDPMQLALSSSVNGAITQQGNTRDMIFSVAALIEYLSSILTLAPGDIILTGTPEGLAHVAPGDVVACEVERLGRLLNTVVEDPATLSGPGAEPAHEEA